MFQVEAVAVLNVNKFLFTSYSQSEKVINKLFTAGKIGLPQSGSLTVGFLESAKIFRGISASFGPVFTKFLQM